MDLDSSKYLQGLGTCKGTNLSKTYCRGIVTADVLAKGLSRRVIATRELNGVNRDKGHEWFIQVRPLTMKVKAYV